MNSIEFQGHLVFQKIEALNNRFHDEEIINKIEIDKLDFYKTACEYTLDKLKNTIPALVLISELDTISQEFDNALNQVNNYIGNNNEGHLNNAVNNLLSALSRVRNLPLVYSNDDFDFAKIVSNFQSTIKSKLDDVNSQNLILNDKLILLNNHINEQETKISGLSELIIQKQTEVSSLNVNFQNDFKTFINTTKNAVEDDRVFYKKEIENDRNKLKTDTDQLLNELQKKLSEARTLVDVIGNVGVTGNYQKVANNHKTTADNWRYAAIGIMISLSSLLICSIWNISDQDFDWHKALIRIIVSAVLIYPATYASKESSKHRKLENYNRKTELELASLSPFIEKLDDEKKQSIKQKLVDKYFGNNLIIDENDTNSKTNEISIGLLEHIVKIITGIISKKGN